MTSKYNRKIKREQIMKINDLLALHGKEAKNGVIDLGFENGWGDNTSDLRKKLMDKMPALSAQSAQLTQKRLESAVPEVNRLLADMTQQLEPAAAKPAAKKP